MKTLLRATAFFSMLIAIACTGPIRITETENKPKPGPINGTLTASINGDSHSSTFKAEANYDAETRTLVITGAQQVSAYLRSISFQLFGVAQPGTIAFESSGNVANYIESVSAFNLRAYRTYYSVNRGSIVITTLTPTRVAGTFSFSAKQAPETGASDTKSVTNGAFDITITR